MGGTPQYFECSQLVSSNHTMMILIKNTSKAGAQDLVSHCMFYLYIFKHIYLLGKDIFKPQLKLQFDFNHEAKGSLKKSSPAKVYA
jgi:hypothetical protein